MSAFHLLATVPSRPVADIAENDHLNRMRVRLALYVSACGLLTATGSLAQTTGPQLPIATGPVESVSEVIREAHACGFRRLRIELRQEILPPTAPVGPASLFLDDVPTEDADRCLDNWITANGVRLRLLPRWHGDTFDQTHHDLYAEARRRNPASQTSASHPSAT